ncbi:MAG TPA: oxidoreductase [Desulfomonilia bacterium]|nr:oxidoreductase [Desulfomonilia bacterium]
MSEKPKVAIYWLTACGGCDETIVDLNEAILQVADAVDIVLWPVAMDFKYKSIKEMKDGGITLSIIHGSVRNSEQEEMAKLLRKKSQLVLAFGACACFGGTPGLANFRSKQDIFNWVYRDAPTVVNPKGNFPQTETTLDGHKLTLPDFYEQVYPLNRIIPVDYYLPGCPPPPDLVAHAVFAVVEGKLPPHGATLAPRKPLCDTCPRNQSKPIKMEISEVKRIHAVEADPEKCFLAQGILCMGPAIRSGCGETCLRINIPCRGCFGPVEGISDAGSKFISGLAALLGAETESDAAKAVEGIADLAGYCYRFSLPSVSLKKKMPQSAR